MVFRLFLCLPECSHSKPSKFSSSGLTESPSNDFAVAAYGFVTATRCTCEQMVVVGIDHLHLYSEMAHCYGIWIGTLARSCHGFTKQPTVANSRYCNYSNENRNGHADEHIMLPLFEWFSNVDAMHGTCSALQWRHPKIANPHFPDFYNCIVATNVFGWTFYYNSVPKIKVSCIALFIEKKKLSFCSVFHCSFDFPQLSPHSLPYTWSAWPLFISHSYERCMRNW